MYIVGFKLINIFSAEEFSRNVEAVSMTLISSLVRSLHFMYFSIHLRINFTKSCDFLSLSGENRRLSSIFGSCWRNEVSNFRNLSKLGHFVIFLDGVLTVTLEIVLDPM